MRRPLPLLLLSVLAIAACTHPTLPADGLFDGAIVTAENWSTDFPLPYYAVVTPDDSVAYARFDAARASLPSWATEAKACCDASTLEPLFFILPGHPYAIYSFIDKSAEPLFERVQNLLPDYQVALLSSDADRKHFLVEAHSDRLPASYYAYDCDSDAIQPLHIPSQIALQDELAPMRPVIISMRDGQPIRAFVTLPVGTDPEAKPHLPTVVMPQPYGGDPWAWEYNPEVQFFAAHGYAVLQADSRAQQNVSAQQAVTDIRDAVNWLINEGIAHPRKVNYYVCDGLPYAAARSMHRNPTLGKPMDHRHRMAFYEDLVHKMKH